MKRFFLLLNYAGAFALLAGLVMRMFLPEFYAMVYICGAALFVVTQFLLRPRYDNPVMRRLVAQQQLAGLLLLGAGVLMFTHYSNEWIVVLLCATIMEVYTVFRLSYEEAKLNKGKK